MHRPTTYPFPCIECGKPLLLTVSNAIPLTVQCVHCSTKQNVPNPQKPTASTASGKKSGSVN